MWSGRLLCQCVQPSDRRQLHGHTSCDAEVGTCPVSDALGDLIPEEHFQQAGRVLPLILPRDTRCCQRLQQLEMQSRSLQEQGLLC